MQHVMGTHNERFWHIWHYRQPSDDWKCVLCGGIVKLMPENPDSDVCDRYEPVTEEEKALAPFRAKVKL